MAIKLMYKLEETSGTSITDYSWNSNTWTTHWTPTLNQPWITGRSILFGTGKYITSSYTWHNNTDFTISCNVKYAGTGDQALFGSSSWNWGWIRYGNPAWTIQISVNGANVANVSDSVTTGKWYNYSLTRSWNNYELWKDGKSILTNTTSWVFSQWNFELAGTVGAAVVFSGNVDDSFIDLRKRSNAEIKNYSSYIKGFI